jgi:RNA polymerase sigma-70 factor, ECF subfamily
MLGSIRSTEGQSHRADDLSLAAACGAGSEDAIAFFEINHLLHVRACLRRLHMSDDVVEEACQILRIRMLVGPPPRITNYNGKIPLTEWLRLSGYRIALDLCQGFSRHRALEEIYASSYLGPRPCDLDHDVDRSRQLPAVQAALERALASLPADGRELLKRHYLEGASIDVIAAELGVHRGTVSRRLLTLRASVLAALRAEVVAVDDIAEVVVSDLDPILEVPG